MFSNCIEVVGGGDGGGGGGHEYVTAWFRLGGIV